MNAAYEFIEQLNWFIQPIAKAVIFLFSTTQGLIVLGVAFFLYFVASFASALWNRKMLHMAARSSYERGRVAGAEKLTLFITHTARVFFQVVMKFPVLLAALVALIFISGASQTVVDMHQYVENQKRIQELRQVVQQLDRSYKVAEITIDNVTYDGEFTTELSIQYFDYAQLGLKEEVQQVTLPGRDIYFDALVLNFDYSTIAQGQEMNLSIPYRVFSDALPQNQGIPLELNTNDSIPYIYLRNEDQLVGLPQDTYQERMKEITTFLHNQEAAQAAGVRSISGNAVHRYVSAGQRYELRIEQSGGMVMTAVQPF